VLGKTHLSYPSYSSYSSYRAEHRIQKEPLELFMESIKKPFKT